MMRFSLLLKKKKEPTEEEVNEGDLWEWPNLYEECEVCFVIALALYALPEIRKLVREGKVTDPAAKDLLQTPFSATSAMKISLDNMELLSPGDQELYGTGLRHLAKMSQDKANSKMFQVVTFEVFNDEINTSDLVYGITINTAEKRIIVGFRGSVTLQDFKTDAKTGLATTRNSLATPRNSLTTMRNSLASQSLQEHVVPETIRIHNGFSEYFYGVSENVEDSGSQKKKKKPRNTENMCAKMLEQVAELLAENPGFRLYTTGHSLGGALATLLAYEAAASQDPCIPKPVTCISFASPKVGNVQLLRSVQVLERQGKLRMLRVANYRDAVTLLPGGGCEGPINQLFFPSRIYRHVGMKIKLQRDRKMEFSYKKADVSVGERMNRAQKRELRHLGHILMFLPRYCCCRENFAKNHSCLEYYERMALVQDKLEKTSLNAMYKKVLGK